MNIYHYCIFNNNSYTSGVFQLNKSVDMFDKYQEILELIAKNNDLYVDEFVVISLNKLG